MNDIFIEQVVKKKRTIKNVVVFWVAVILTVLTPVLLFSLVINRVITTYFSYIALFLFVIGVWVCWFIHSHQNVEYEYQMVQEHLVVSKVVAKRIRRHITKVNVKEFEILDKGNDPSMDRMKFIKVYEACATLSDEDNTYYAIFKSSGHGKNALLFNPNEKILNAMKPYLKKEIVLKLFYNRDKT